MGILQANVFLTLDGVYQAPGGPDEDREGGFASGGWQGAYSDEGLDASIGTTVHSLDALLLGRKTYEIFAGYWPAHDEHPVGAHFNTVPKFVATHTVRNPSWENTMALRNPGLRVRALKERFGQIHMFGSGELLRFLLAEDLVDRLNLLLYPLVLGSGKRLFEAGTTPAAFTVAHAPRVFSAGAVSLVYERAGVPVTGVDISRPAR